MNERDYSKFLSAKNLIKNRKYWDALLVLEKLLDKDDDIRIKYEYLKLAIKLGENEKALKYLIPWYNNGESNERTFAAFSLGKIAVKERNEEEALKYLGPIIEKKGYNYFFAAYELGCLYFYLNDYEKAIHYFSIANTSSNNNTAALSKYRIGVSYMELGSFDVAKKYFLELLNGTSKDKSLALVKLGQIEHKLGNYIESKQYYDELSLSPNFKDKAFAKLGIALLEVELGDVSLAESLLEELIDNKLINRNYVIFELSKVKIRLRKFGEARKYLNILLESGSPKDRDFAIYQLGIIEERVGNSEKATSLYEDSSFTDESFNNEYCAIRVGKIKAKDGEYEEALEIFEPLLDSPDKSVVVLALAEIARLETKFGNYLRAKTLYEEICEIGNNKDKSFALLELGILSMQFEQFEEAMMYLVPLFENSFVDDKAKFFYAKLLVRLNQYFEAIELLEGVKLNNQDPVHFELLKLYILTEQYDKALNEITYVSDKELHGWDMSKYLYFIKSKFGILDAPKDYYSRQVANYSREEAIKLNKRNFNVNEEYLEDARFDKDLSMETLYNEISDILDITLVEHFGIYDRRIYDFGAMIGDFCNYRTPFIEIITIADTDKILSIQPVYSKHSNVMKNNKNNKVRVR